MPSDFDKDISDVLIAMSEISRSLTESIKLQAEWLETEGLTLGSSGAKQAIETIPGLACSQDHRATLARSDIKA